MVESSPQSVPALQSIVGHLGESFLIMKLKFKMGFVFGFKFFIVFLSLSLLLSLLTIDFVFGFKFFIVFLSLSLSLLTKSILQPVLPSPRNQRVVPKLKVVYANEVKGNLKLKLSFKELQT